MNNRIFLKIFVLLSGIILSFLLFMAFIISPKISDYLLEAEIKNAKIQLDKISSIVKLNAKILQNYEKDSILNHKKIIKEIGNASYSIAEVYYSQYLSKDLSKEKAMDLAFKTMSKIKYGYENDYIYVIDSKGKVLYHPDSRYSKHNIYLENDAKGEPFAKKLIKNTVENGFYYSKYNWTKLDKKTKSDKLVYSIYFEPLDMIIVTGIYLDNIKMAIGIQKQVMLENTKELLSSIVLGKTGYVYIFNEDNKMLSHPLLGDKVLDKLNNKSLESLKEAYKENKPYKYLWNKPDDKNNFNYKKVSWVEYNDYFKWYIVSSIYEDEFLEDASNINNMIFELSFFILIGIFFLSFFAIKKLLSPIDILSKDARKIQNGDFSVRNSVKTDDELGLLAKQFNFMLDTIEDNIQNLEHKVELRTLELKNKLHYDELTKLRNRYSLLEDIKDYEFATVTLVDIDHFDNVNELYGFSTGNSVLIKVSERLEEFCSEYGLKVYRVHGNVFAILDSSICDFGRYESFVRRLSMLFKDKAIHVSSLNIDLFIDITIGISIAQDDPLKTATIALKKAKKNHLAFLIYNNLIDTKEHIENLMLWKDKIKYAIDYDKIVPFYQPILDRDKNIIKYETLMRIKDDSNGKEEYLLPYLFFDVAIQTKQYKKLSKKVITKAFEDINKTSKDISINLSFKDIEDKEFLKFIDYKISNMQDDERKRLVFEILESDNVLDYSVLEEFVNKYKDQGIKIAIDDFGTGYSNFEHILRIRPDYLKVDGSLIKNIDSDRNSYTLVKSIVEFSKALNIKVIAEYIHSEEVFQIAYDLGVDEFQGFHFGKPEPQFLEN